MADSSIAPDPPAGWVKPPSYIALRCQFCLNWTTSPSPFTHSKASQDKFFPLMPWYQGTRECPKGYICLVCVNVAWISFVQTDAWLTGCQSRCICLIYKLRFTMAEDGNWKSVASGNVLPISRQILRLNMSTLTSTPIEIHQDTRSFLLLINQVFKNKNRREQFLFVEDVIQGGWSKGRHWLNSRTRTPASASAQQINLEHTRVWTATLGGGYTRGIKVRVGFCKLKVKLQTWTLMSIFVLALLTGNVVWPRNSSSQAFPYQGFWVCKSQLVSNWQRHWASSLKCPPLLQWPKSLLLIMSWNTRDFMAPLWLAWLSSVVMEFVGSVQRRVYSL